MRQKVFYGHGHVRLIERSVKVEYGLDARLRVCLLNVMSVKIAERYGFRSFDRERCYFCVIRRKAGCSALQCNKI